MAWDVSIERVSHIMENGNAFPLPISRVFYSCINVWNKQRQQQGPGLFGLRGRVSQVGGDQFRKKEREKKKKKTASQKRN